MVQKALNLRFCKFVLTWWKDKAGSLRGNFDLKDKLGNTIRFDNEFRNHVLEDNKDNRFAMLNNIESIITGPDEIWSIRDNGKLITSYVKYFDNYPYVIKTDNNRAFTLYAFEESEKLNEKSASMARRGILLYRMN